MGLDEIEAIEKVGKADSGKKGGISWETHRCRPAKPHRAGAQFIGIFKDKWLS